METLSTVSRSFVAYLRAHSCRVPDELVGPFLNKLLEIFKDERVSDEVKVLHDLLCELLEPQSKFCDAANISLRFTLVNVVDVLFANLLDQRLIRKFQTEGEYILPRIQELERIVSCMVESENGAFEKTANAPISQEHLDDSSYVAYTVAHPDPSTSWVLVVSDDQEAPQQTKDRAEGVSVGIQCNLIDTADGVMDEYAEEEADMELKEEIEDLMKCFEAARAARDARKKENK